jgi:hypothetical protein
MGSKFKVQSWEFKGAAEGQYVSPFEPLTLSFFAA